MRMVKCKTNWRIYLDERCLQYDDWKRIRKWFADNDITHYRISSAGFIEFMDEQDAVIFYLENCNDY